MKKILAIAIVFAMMVALFVPAFAASHADAGVEAGAKLLEADFSGDAVVDSEIVAWSGYSLQDGSLHLGHGGDWVASSPIARTADTFTNYIANFKMVGDKRDCYYGFGLRCNDQHTLMNGGRFGVPSAEEKAVGIAIDIFGAANSTLGDNIGVTFCDNGANGNAPAFTIARPEGFDPGVNTAFTVADSGDKITISIEGKELLTIELSGLADGNYTSAAAYDANGNELFNGAVTVLEEGTICFYQRNNHIIVSDFTVSELTKAAAPSDEVVVHGASFDSIFVNDVLNFGEGDGGASGKLDNHDRTVDGSDGSVTSITLRGWIGFEGQGIDQFGYQVGDSAPVFADSNREERGDIGAIRDPGNGGEFADAYRIVIDTTNIKGTKSIIACVKLADGTVVKIDESVKRNGEGTTPNTSFTFIGVPDDTQPTTGGEEVPKTGDATVAMFAVLAVLAMGAAVVFAKKRSF